VLAKELGLDSPTLVAELHKQGISVKSNLSSLDEETAELVRAILREPPKEEKEEKDDNYYCCERSYGAFSRSLAVPAGVSADKINATFQNGVLEVHLPKTKESTGKKIEIKAG